jgi:hypothetical protein
VPKSMWTCGNCGRTEWGAVVAGGLMALVLLALAFLWGPNIEGVVWRFLMTWCVGAVGLIFLWVFLAGFIKALRARPAISTLSKTEASNEAQSSASVRTRYKTSRPTSADEWIALLSTSKVSVAERVRIAYEFQWEYADAAEEKLREVLIHDNAVRKAILRKFNAETRADVTRLMEYVEQAAIEAKEEVAHRGLSASSSKPTAKHLRALKVDELVALLKDTEEPQQPSLFRHIILACDTGQNRSALREIFETDSGDRALSRELLRVLITTMWVKGDRRHQLKAGDVLIALGHEFAQHEGEQWFGDVKAEVMLAATGICKSARLKRGAEPFTCRTIYAITLLGDLGDGSALPVLQRLLDKLRSAIDARGETREYVDDGTLVGWKSDKDAVRLIKSAIKEIRDRV